MLESIIDAVRGQVVTALSEKTGLNPGEAEQTVPLARESVSEGVTGALSGGNIGGILDMLRGASGGTGGGLMENVVFQSIAGKFIDKLTTRLGLPAGVARQISAVALPIILGKLAGSTRAAGDTDDIDQGSLMTTLGLDPGSLLSGLGKGLFGKKDGDGGGGLGDLFK